MMGCSYMIYELYSNTGINSIASAIDDRMESIMDINFPAMTIFPLHRKSEFEKLYVSRFSPNWFFLSSSLYEFPCGLQLSNGRSILRPGETELRPEDRELVIE